MTGNYRKFSQEEIKAVNELNIVDLAQSMGLELRNEGRNMRIPGMGGLLIKSDGSCFQNRSDNSESASGGTIKFYMYMNNCTFPVAVNDLLNRSNYIEPVKKQNIHSEEKQPFEMPSIGRPDNESYRDMLKYLYETRKLNPEIVAPLINKGDIFLVLPKDKNRNHYCGFAGRDEGAKIKYVSRKPIYAGSGISADVSGSQKRYGFKVLGSTNKLFVFEAPIDLLSYMSLKANRNLECKDNYLSLGGLSANSLKCFLNNHPNIDEIVFALDNDIHGTRKTYDREVGEFVEVPHNHGQEFAKSLSKEYKDLGYRIKLALPDLPHKDWNDMIKSERREQKMEMDEPEI